MKLELILDRNLLDCIYNDARYFVIKSNNYENVMIAKHRVNVQFIELKLLGIMVNSISK